MHGSLRLVASALVLAVCFCGRSPAFGQEQNEPERRIYSVSLAAAEGAELGIWRRMHPRASLGIGLGANYEDLRDDKGSERFSLFVLEPAIKFGPPPGDLPAPYLFGSLFVETGETRAAASAGGATATATRTSRRSGASVGGGLDWFPALWVSIGGHLGVRGGRTSRTLRVDGVSESPTDQAGSFFSTFSSGVRVHLYFGPRMQTT